MIPWCPRRRGRIHPCIVLLGVLLVAPVTSPAVADEGVLRPTFEDVRYGPHERNVLDFWKARSDRSTPLVVFIHGGGFVGGDKSKGRGSAVQTRCLGAGVSYAAINYRFRTQA